MGKKMAKTDSRTELARQQPAHGLIQGRICPL